MAKCNLHLSVFIESLCLCARCERMLKQCRPIGCMVLKVKDGRPNAWENVKTVVAVVHESACYVVAVGLLCYTIWSCFKLVSYIGKEHVEKLCYVGHCLAGDC